MRLVLALVLTLLALPAHAQHQADLADVTTLSSIIDTVYAVISGPYDEDRDWSRFRTLFHPDAQLIPNNMPPPDKPVGTVLSVDEYIEWATDVFRNAPLFQGQGFYEVEATRRVERYGTIAHIWSTYESRGDPAAEPFARGINSFQLSWDGAVSYTHLTLPTICSV